MMVCSNHSYETEEEMSVGMDMRSAMLGLCVSLCYEAAHPCMAQGFTEVYSFSPYT